MSVLERAARQEAAAAATKEEQGAPTVDSLQSKALTRKASAPNRVALTVPSNNTLAAATSQRLLHSHTLMAPQVRPTWPRPSSSRNCNAKAGNSCGR